MNLFRPKSFLRLGGGLLLFFGILGLVGILGPTSSQSIFGNYWWFDSLEASVLIISGLAFIIVTLFFTPVWQRYLVILIGFVALAIGIYSFVGSSLFEMHLEVPGDLAFYLIIGAWALYASFAAGLKRR